MKKTETFGPAPPKGRPPLLEVATPVGDPPARVYRRAFPLELPTGGTAEAIVVDPEETTLTATFDELVYDVLDPPHPDLAGSLAAEGDAVVVALDGPRRVHLVRVDGGGTVDLHRLDGDNPVEDPSVSGTSGWTIADDFTDRRFAVRRGSGSLATGDLDELEVRSYPTGPRAGIAAPSADEAAFFWRAAGEVGKPSQPGDPAANPPESAGVVADGAAFAAELQRYVDTLPAPLPTEVEVDLVLESDAPCGVRNVVPSVEYRLVSRSFGAPLYGRGDVKDAAGLARSLGEARDAVSKHVHGLLSPAARKLVESDVPDEGALVAELNALAAGPLVYDADAFAQVDLNAATREAAEAEATGNPWTRLNRALLDAAYPDHLAAPAEKRVLRFPGERAETRELTVVLPAGATVVQATLTTIEALRADRPASGNSVGDERRTTGVTVAGTTLVAAATTPAEPLAATGLALWLLPTSDRAELLIELREDHAGTPTGRTIAASQLAVESLGVARGGTVIFAEPVPLSARPYWIVVRATSGGAVWLADEAAGDVRVLEVADGSPRGRLSDVDPLHELLSRSAELQAEPAVILRVAGKRVAPAPSAGDKRTYDLASALNAYLLGKVDGPVAVPLTLTAAIAGTVTVQPPVVEYEVD
jgi:hypothetical protein